ncbi:MAG: Glu-tRNA(Gln) amidotransferase subunit GatD [Acidilobaceae archaeon]|nr:Glu-tRNA(Gln) amidotransferase subunit GatD [Acidilobaceae archaeon]
MSAYGYSGRLARLLERLGIEPGDKVRVRKGGRVLEGIVMPSYGSGEVLVIKLGNGYNVGVEVEEGSIEKVGRAERGPPGSPVPLLEKVEVGEGRVFVLGCGGTVASRVDYETGAVRPYLTAEELALSSPEMLRYARIEAKQLLSILSEDMKPRLWEEIVRETAKAIEGGYDGIVIAHGTDTMSYTAAALSFAFHKGLPVPIAMTGAQRSSDRPSSDASFNLVAATLVAAKAPFAEVSVVMHGESGDTYALAHRGVRVRKMHSSRRDAFRSVNARPLAKVWPYEGKIELVEREFRRRGGELVVENGFEERVALIKHFPGMIAEVIEALLDKGFRGLVIEGTGLGHVSSDAIAALERAREMGVPVVVSTQTIFGRVNLNVYSTGRRMLAAGAIPVEDMLAEVAYVKLSWALARTRELQEVRRIMTTNLAGEISYFHGMELFPVSPNA